MSSAAAPTIGVLHGVNLDQLGRRDPAHYGSMDLPALERKISDWAQQLKLSASFFHTNHEGEFVERLHAAAGSADALILNPGAWTHYSYAIRDALEIAALPTVEVHLSAVAQREQWRQLSVIGELCVATVAGRGAEGYREALEILEKELRQA